MNYAIVAAALAAIIIVVTRIIDAIRSDEILSKLHPDEDRKADEQFQKEFGDLNQEIKNAKIEYDATRRNALAQPPSSSGEPVPGRD